MGNCWWLGNGTKIFYSADGGSTWTNVSKNLPNFPANIVKQERNNPKNAIYVGLDVGVYYTDNTMTTWEPFMKGLPNSTVRDLEINETAGLIRAGTYGRGIWESDLYSITIGVKTAPTNEQLTVYPNPSPGIFTIRLNDALSNEAIEIEVFNQLGEKVLVKQVRMGLNDQTNVDISNLPNGVYILNFKTSEAAWHEKIVKQ
jgi:hypothetical protein